MLSDAAGAVDLVTKLEIRRSRARDPDASVETLMAIEPALEPNM
jgi:hypothetical protein